MPIKHEIVKFEVTPDVVMADNLPERMEQNACFSNEPSKDSVVEIVLSNVSVTFASDILKRNTDSVKCAMENDVFGSIPDDSMLDELEGMLAFTIEKANTIPIQP